MYFIKMCEKGGICNINKHKEYYMGHPLTLYAFKALAV